MEPSAFSARRGPDLTARGVTSPARASGPVSLNTRTDRSRTGLFGNDDVRDRLRTELADGPDKSARRYKEQIEAVPQDRDGKDHGWDHDDHDDWDDWDDYDDWDWEDYLVCGLLHGFWDCFWGYPYYYNHYLFPCHHHYFNDYFWYHFWFGYYPISYHYQYPSYVTYCPISVPTYTDTVVYYPEYVAPEAAPPVTAEPAIPADLADELERLGSNADAVAWLEQGAASFKSGKYREAADAFRKTTLAEPGNAVPKFAYAHALFAIGEYEYAAFFVRRGLELMPEWPSVGTSLHELYGRPDDLAEHTIGLRVYAATHEEDGDARFLLGYISFFSGDLDGAEAAFQAVAQTNPADAGTQTFLKRIGEIRAALGADKGK